MDVSLYDDDKTLDRVKRKILKVDIPQKNKDLLLDFASDCLTGWQIPKISKSRTSSYYKNYPG